MSGDIFNSYDCGVCKKCTIIWLWCWV